MAVFYLADNEIAVIKRCVAIPGDTISLVNGYFKLSNGVQVGLLQSQDRGKGYLQILVLLQLSATNSWAYKLHPTMWGHPEAILQTRPRWCSAIGSVGHTPLYGGPDL